MKKWKETVSALSETITVTKLDGVLVVTISALVGVIIGMLCSPRKNVKFGCSNGNTMTHNWGEDEWLEDEDDSFYEDEDDCLYFK